MEHETKTDENGVKYINLEPTPQGYADMFYMGIMYGETQEVKDNALIELLHHYKHNPNITIGARRRPV